MGIKTNEQRKKDREKRNKKRSGPPRKIQKPAPILKITYEL